MAAVAAPPATAIITEEDEKEAEGKGSCMDVLLWGGMQPAGCGR